VFIIEPMPPRIDPDLLGLLAEVEPATIGHFRHAGFMDPGLRPVIPGRRVAGTAVTVRAPAGDATMQHYVLGRVRAGDVIVMDRCGDTRHASWGGLTSAAAREAGVAGVLIDGVACDFEEIRAAGVPVWCRGSSAITLKLQGIGGELNTPVACGGVPVWPGDLVLADETGIVVLSPEDIRPVAEQALALQRREQELLAGLRGGKKLPDLSGCTALIEEARRRGQVRMREADGPAATSDREGEARAPGPPRQPGLRRARRTPQ
jgi:regulator of RNase E activity RraA